MVDHVHDWRVLIVWEAQRQHPGTFSARIGCAGCRQAMVSTMMEPCPWPEDLADCPDCDGAGVLRHFDPSGEPNPKTCRRCDGTGLLPRKYITVFELGDQVADFAEEVYGRELVPWQRQALRSVLTSIGEVAAAQPDGDPDEVTPGGSP